jgi:hypothetical protein
MARHTHQPPVVLAIKQAYSREANDLGQWLFALYVAASVVLAATRAGRDLGTDAIARHYRPATRRLFADGGNLLAVAKCCRLQSAWACAIGAPTFPALPSAKLAAKQPDMARVEVGVSAELAEPWPWPRR